MVGEDHVAELVLATAEFYFQTAIERDELATYRMTGQEDLGRGVRLKLYCFARWFRERALDIEAFRLSCQMRQISYEESCALGDWRKAGFSLAEWMAEQLVLGEFEEAKRIYDRHSDRSIKRRTRDGRLERALYRVTESLMQPGDQRKQQEARRLLEGAYQDITAWGKPGFRPEDMSPCERFLYAYVRGRYFKNEEDPIRLIRWMKNGI